MEIHQLRYFLAVARELNFSRAAERSFVAQPSLSQQIRKLEEELGERLFERTRREVALTPAGEAFRAHAQRVLENLEEARASVAEFSGEPRGRVVLGGLPTVVPYLFPGLLRTFVARHPKVEVVVHEDTTAQLSAAVHAREIDLAVVSLPVEAPGLESEALFAENLLVALPEGHALAGRRRLALADLDAESFVLMKEGHCLAGQALQFCSASGFQPHVSFRSAQIETLLAFVAAGWGVSIVPRMAARVWKRPGVRFRELAGLRRSVGLLWRRTAVRSRACEALIAHLRETAR